MVKIYKQILTKNDCYTKGGKMKPVGIMVHSTGANNPALSRYVGPDDGILGVNKYNNHWNQPNMNPAKCVHAFIGKDKNGVSRIYQTLPWDMPGWHSGSGSKGYSNNANNKGYIGFEICEDDLKDRKYFNEVYNLAVELCAYLVEKYDSISIGNIIGHYEGWQLGIASNHGDPKHWFSKHGKSMDGFRNDVKKALKQTVSENTPKLGSTFHVKKETDGYYTAADAKAGKNKRTTVKVGVYYVFNTANGMINVTSKNGVPGSWINPYAKASEPKPKEESKTFLIRVKAEELWYYDKPDWNAKKDTVKRGDVFTVVDTLDVNGSKMYKLKSGTYITANTQYVEKV